MIFKWLLLMTNTTNLKEIVQVKINAWTAVKGQLFKRLQKGLKSMWGIVLKSKSWNEWQWIVKKVRKDEKMK